ncbi:M48 family metalloprotease [Helicobacter sp. 23-1045]
MSDDFCTTFLARSGEVRGFVDLLFTIFYTIKCSFSPIVFVIFGIICAVGVFFILANLKSRNIFFTIIKLFIALMLTALAIFALIGAFGNFEARIYEKDSTLSRIVLYLAMQNVSFHARTLGIVIYVSIALFFATRIILGRQVEIHGDFWEHQNLAKRKVWWLNVLFFIMLVLICVCAFSLFQMIFLGFDAKFNSEIEIDKRIAMTNAIITMRENFDYDRFIEDFNNQAFIANRIDTLKASFGLSAFFALSLWFAYLFKNFQMRSDGIDKLAKALKADEIFAHGYLKGANSGESKKYKMLFSVVEEMAIASNMPMPRVFVMSGESGVNAMCSGERFGSADECVAIFVTQGAIENFTRDELQGVIAHEFSHAFHGDVALNLKIFSLIFGLTFIMMIGEFLLRSASKSNRSHSSKNNGSGAIALVLIALVFFVLGFLGQIFAKIIQSAISRQKEFLADASSVQYTRNVAGIKSALKRIMDLQNSAKNAQDLGIKKGNAGFMENVNAEPCAHMFFLNVGGFLSKIFATHPSLESRIRALNKIG